MVLSQIGFFLGSWLSHLIVIVTGINVKHSKLVEKKNGLWAELRASVRSEWDRKLSRAWSSCLLCFIFLSMFTAASPDSDYRGAEKVKQAEAGGVPSIVPSACKNLVNVHDNHDY